MSDVLVVSEAPIKGKTNERLARILETYDIDDYRLTSALDQPTERPRKSEIESCKQSLQKQIKKTKPKFVVLMGNIALQAALGLKGIKKLRGKPIEQDGIVYFPTYNPSVVLYDPALEFYVYKDFKFLGEMVDHGGVIKEEALDVVIIDDAKKFQSLKRDLKGVISIDVEATCLYPWQQYAYKKKKRQEVRIEDPAKIVSIGFGTKDKQYVLPVSADAWHVPFTKDIVQTMLEEIDDLLDDCLVITHNGKFDFLWLWVHFGLQWYKHMHFDTMLAHYMLDENDFHGLDHLAKKYFGAPDYDVPLPLKQGKEGTLAKHAEYLGLDLLYTRNLYAPLLKELQKEGDVKRVFDHIMMPCARMFTEVEYDGVCIDMTKMGDAEKHLLNEMQAAHKNLRKWGDINWASTKQLATLLFTRDKIGGKRGLGLKPIEVTKKGAPSTSESVLLRLDHPVRHDLIRYRGARQQYNFFIKGWKPYLVEVNGQWFLHPSFKLHGTVTGRLSCEHPNLQQVPRDVRIRQLITAPDGWTLVEADLSQIELRIAAELAQERTMLDAFHKGVDVHWNTAMRELERGGGGKHVETFIRTAKVYLMSLGLRPDRTSAKKVLEVYSEKKKVPEPQKLLRMAAKEWTNKATRDWEWWRSGKFKKSLLAGGRKDLAEKISQETLRDLWQLSSCVPASQGREPKKLEEIKFTDAMSLVSYIGPSEAEDAQKTWKEEDPEKLWKEIRKKAKAVGFGYLYGMWWKKFKIYARDNYGVVITDEQAEASREFFFATFPGFGKWHQRQKRYARMNGYVLSLSKRKRRLPAAMDPDDNPFRREAERQAINSPVQSFANEINLMAALQLRKEFPRTRVRLCGTVHDALLLWVKNEYVAKVTERLLTIMSRPELFDKFDIELSVPVLAEAKVGAWGAGISYERWRSQNVSSRKRQGSSRSSSRPSRLAA